MRVFALLSFLFLPVLATAADAPADTSSIHEVGDIVVTASRYDDTTQLNVTNIGHEELQIREPDQALPLLLQSQPGVFAYSDAGSGLGYTYLKVRGFDQRRVGVLFEGIPLNDPEDHQIWWVNMPDLAESVQDIQVQRGVTNSVGGMTAIGGTVNIAARQLGSEPRGRELAVGEHRELQRDGDPGQSGRVGEADQFCGQRAYSLGDDDLSGSRGRAVAEK